MRLAFWVDNVDKQVDLKQIVKGNPGVGGTLYNTVMTVWYLTKTHKENEYWIIHSGVMELPDGIEDIQFEEYERGIEWCKQEDIDYLVIVFFKSEAEKRVVEKYMVNVIAWPSIFLSPQQLNWIADCEYVRQVVWVGRQQNDFYLDHRISQKSCYIYNPLYIDGKERNVARDNSCIVTYIGGLYPQKGFHVLAAMWPLIKRRVKEAELYVCGSGKLYNRRAELGKYGVAEEQYEQQFMKYLTDSQGNILPEIHFLGTVDSDKRKKILKKTKVGVVNPTANTETFCNSAVEMEYANVPVVTVSKLGFLDTVPNGIGGMTAITKLGMRRHIISLLLDDKKNVRLGMKANRYVIDTFDLKQTGERWAKLISKLAKGDIVVSNHRYNHIFKDLKWMKIINKKAKDILGRDWISVDEMLWMMHDIIRKHMRRL